MPLSHALRVITEGWTQLRLSAATDIPQERLSRILSGARGSRPTLPQIGAIERAVGRPRGFVLTLAGFASSEGAALAEQWLNDIVRMETEFVTHQLEADLNTAAVNDFLKGAVAEELMAADTGTQEPGKGPETKPEPPDEQDDV